MILSTSTWLISDTHFGHKNIVKFCNRPENHDCLMLERWAETMPAGEDILHLGDLGLRGANRWFLDLVKALPGNKYLIKGNHDKWTDERYEALGFTIVPDEQSFVYEDKCVVLSHYPLPADKMLDFFINIHGHIHNNGYAPDIPEDKDYRNISIEVMDYRPWRLQDVLERGKYQSRKEAGVNAFEVARLGTTG